MKTTVYKFVCFLLLTAYFLPVTAFAQYEEGVKPGGYVRGVGWVGSKKFDYTNLFGEFALKLQYNNKATFAKLDARIREGLFLGETKTCIELKEAYAGIQTKVFKFYLGNQIVPWGRTDGFNPTDNINPKDYFLLTPDPEDQRLGNFMLRVKISPSSNSQLELISIPFYKPSVYRYDLFALGDGTTFDETVKPELSFANAAFAGRLNFDLPFAGFSFSYFNGFNPFHGFKLKSFTMTQAPEIVFIPDFYRKQTIGMDFEIPFSRILFRGEVAYNLTKDYKQNMHIPNPDLTYVAGMELDVAGINIIAQYVGKYTFSYSPLIDPVLLNPYDPVALYNYAYGLAVNNAILYNRKINLQQEETNSALFLSLRRSFGFDLLTISASGYYNLTSEEYMYRPEIKWKPDDQLTMTLGGNVMGGPDNSIFFHSGKVMTGFYMGLAFTF